jgi:hypothetical protein
MESEMVPRLQTDWLKLTAKDVYWKKAGIPFSLLGHLVV